MLIFEQYAKRLGIVNNNVQYLSNSIVFTKDYHHKIIKINKICNPGYADKFEIIINAEDYPSFARPTQAYYDIEWDNYEDFIVEKLYKFKNHICDNREDVFISAWEIFVVRHQSYFCEHVGLNTFYKSLDERFSKKERMKEIENLIIKFELEKEGWNKIIKYIDRYSYWLANFINSLN
jgi:hypothetical protein